MVTLYPASRWTVEDSLSSQTELNSPTAIAVRDKVCCAYLTIIGKTDDGGPGNRVWAEVQAVPASAPSVYRFTPPPSRHHSAPLVLTLPSHLQLPRSSSHPFFCLLAVIAWIRVHEEENHKQHSSANALFFSASYLTIFKCGYLMRLTCTNIGAASLAPLSSIRII